MPTIHAKVTAPTFRTEITDSLLTINLPERHMRVEISDDGTVRVTQESYDILNGALSDPDYPRYAPGGEYEFRLPDQVDVNAVCDTPLGSPDFDNGGTFTITAAHRH
jgi:hypothetical protein